MKKILALILALVMALSLVACGSKDDNDTPDDGKKTNTIKVGLICIGDENDQGYTYNFIRGKEAATEALAAKGMDIAVNYAGSAAAAEQTAADCRALGVQAVALQADVRRPEACKQLVEDAAAAFGRLDVLVNNAGVTADKLLLQMTEADFDAVIETNLKGAFFCTKAAARLMMRQRYGRIISVSSVVGLHGNAGQANYAASKAGLIGLMKSVAKEYASRGVTANTVAPGFITTDMTAAMPEAARAAANAAIPMGKPGRPEDVAAAIAFLAGERAGYITGQLLCIDGGMGM